MFVWKRDFSHTGMDVQTYLLCAVVDILKKTIDEFEVFAIFAHDESAFKWRDTWSPGALLQILFVNIMSRDCFYLMDTFKHSEA